ncbi:diguanylate cyclase [Paenibacillus sp. 1001270B_150601_E10]|uniref:sensor domain-containing diguanylate cyclase n=1 Tax=Paenibacillus sp. 1001270B_150601_E10 TaxID=2787079 RepID=UPI0018A12589|nr:sensor domain-containing diguanylate cyclase [Paenibacillus sp. 1001270B_150601_E10]
MDDRLNYAPCGFISISHEGMILEVNHTFGDQMGYNKSELIGKHIESLMSIANKLIFHSYFYPFINLNGHVDELFISLKNKQGEPIPYLLNGRRLDKDGLEIMDCILMQMGKRIHYEQELRMTKKHTEEAYIEKDQALEKLKHIYQEIESKQAELIEMNSLLVELSSTDKLTGIKNRRYFQEKLDELIRCCHDGEQSFSLLIVDIDHFKRINDKYGHQTGDDVLAQLASILSDHSRELNIPARYGGEEFVMILPGQELTEAKKTAELLREAVADYAWEIGNLTVSIGAATFTQDDTSTSLLKHADQALYVSKENGRNQVTHYDEMK